MAEIIADHHVEPGQFRHDSPPFLVSVITGAAKWRDPVIPLRMASSCHMIGMAGTSPAMTIHCFSTCGLTQFGGIAAGDQRLDIVDDDVRHHARAPRAWRCRDAAPARRSSCASTPPAPSARARTRRGRRRRSSFSLSARTSAASSMIAPRAVLMMKAVCFIRANSRIADLVAGFLRERRMQRNEIRFAQQFVERHDSHSNFTLLPSGLRRGVPVNARAWRSPARGCATALPISPPPPTRPSVLPWTITADQVARLRRREICRRARACRPRSYAAPPRSSARMQSAVASVATIGGTTVTGMPRFVAAATSIFDGVIDCAAMTARNFGLAASTARSILSCSSKTRCRPFSRAGDQPAPWG